MKKITLIIALILIISPLGLFLYFKSIPNLKMNFVVRPESRVMNVGFVSADPETVSKYKDLLVFFNKNSQKEWRLVELKNYGDLILKIQSGQLQAGFAGGLATASLIKLSQAAPVFRPEKNGVSTYSATIIARKDKGITSLESLRGKRFAFVDPFTVSGYLALINELKSQGIDEEIFFESKGFLGSYEKVGLAVLNGEFDGGILKTSVWNKLSTDNRASDINVISTIGNYPETSFVLEKNYYNNLDVLSEIKIILNKLHNTDEGMAIVQKFGDKFVDSKIEDYREIADMLQNHEL